MDRYDNFIFICDILYTALSAAWNKFYQLLFYWSDFSPEIFADNIDIVIIFAIIGERPANYRGACIYSFDILFICFCKFKFYLFPKTSPGPSSFPMNSAKHTIFRENLPIVDLPDGLKTPVKHRIIRTMDHYFLRLANGIDIACMATHYFQIKQMRCSKGY